MTDTLGPAFYAAVRRSLFGGSLTQSQVDGLERLVAAFALYGTGDRRHLAYGLATSFHETGKRMEPVREGFAETDAGVRAAVAKLYKAGRISANYALPNAAGRSFYGRGDVQLTFERNYVEMGRIIGLPLAADPDRVLDPAVSARVMWEGLLRGASNRGDFTGKALEDYIGGTRCDYLGARRTVNGTDKAEAIAGYARAFESALIADGVPAMAAPRSKPDQGPAPASPPIAVSSSPPKPASSPLSTKPAPTGGLLRSGAQGAGGAVRSGLAGLYDAIHNALARKA